MVLHYTWKEIIEIMMKRKTVLASAIVLALLLGALAMMTAFPRTHAAAAPDRVTYGDVQAILHAGLKGGLALQLHGHEIKGAPSEANARAILGFFLHGKPEFCVDDWHLVRIGVLNSVDDDAFFTKEQVVADLEQTTVTFTLDGAPQPTIQTPITQLNTADQQLLGEPGATFMFQAGSIFSPTAISVGAHVVGFTITDPVFGALQGERSITIDAAGTGACL